MREARVLINNAAVVESIFQELGPGFATCFRYESMSDPEQTHRVARFIAPDDVTAQHLEEKMLENVKPRSASASRPGSKPSNPTMEWAPQQVGLVFFFFLSFFVGFFSSPRLVFFLFLM